MPERYSDYDGFAWFYNRHWGRDFHRQALGILDRLLFPRLKPGAHVLDLCCGTGQFTAALVERGFRVIGIDGSESMIRHALENAPGCEFVVADARDFDLPEPVDAAVSMFDSLNHVMSVEDLERVFVNVHGALAPGGWFVFDLNRENAYRYYWNGPWAIVEDDNVCVSVGSYDDAERLARCDVTMFRLEGEWRRSDVTLYQRCHDVQRVSEALQAAGFGGVFLYDSEDVGMKGDIACARTFFMAQA
jgi:SAM-dependent methyltransferase